MAEGMTVQWLANALLGATMVIGAYSDIRWRRLPNWLTLGAAVVGLALHASVRGADGARDSLVGWLLGVGLLFIPFFVGGMGAGDVKLLAAVGALRGPSFVVSAFIYTALAGGALATAVLIRRGGLFPVLRKALGALSLLLRSVVRYRSLAPLGHLAPLAAAGETGAAGKPPGELAAATLPYGVAIAAGSLLALVLGY